MKELPKNLELERSVAGLIVQDSQQYDQVAAVLSADCFTDPFCRQLFEAVQHHDKKGIGYDSLIISQHIAEKTGKKTTQTFIELSEVERSVKSYSNTSSYVATLKELSLRRVTYQKIGKIAYKALDETVNIHESINELSKILIELEGGIQNGGARTVAEIMPDVIEEMDLASQNATGISGIPTLIRAVDDTLSGLNKGALIIVAARPAMGKTALALNMMMNISAYQAVPSLFISLEMTETDLVKRLICTHCDIDSEAIRSGRLTDPQYEQFHKKIQPLIGSEIFIDDCGGVDIVQIKSKIRQAVTKNNVKAVFIDYLQLIAVDDRNRSVSIGAVTTELKRVAKEFEIPIILLSQLSRKCEERADKRPMLSDLRDSGSIEQDADAVVFLYRDVVYNPQPTDNNGNQVELDFAEAIWAKNRHGSTGTKDLKFTGNRFKFEDYAAEPTNPF
jgi:replicative DNA helicase